MKSQEFLKEEAEEGSQQDNKKLSQELFPKKADQEPKEPQDQETDQDDSAINDFKQSASDLGADLYSITPWNYYEIFADGEAVADDNNLSAIQQVAKLSPENKQAYSAFRSWRGTDLGQDRTVSNIILNARNGRILHFVADPAGETGFSFGLPGQLAADGIVDTDQATILNKILDAGNAYADAVGNDPEWEPGTSTPKIDKAEDKLFDKLKISSLKFAEPELDDYTKNLLATVKKQNAEYWAKKEQDKTNSIKSRHGK